MKKLKIKDFYGYYTSGAGFLSKKEKFFSKELYMNIDQIKMMMDCGMHIGSHAYSHYWLGSLSKEQQIIEIDKSLDFLSSIGVDTVNWTMCYPYGSFNNDTLEILSKKHCKLALTVETGVADVLKENKYLLSRLDTNDMPKNIFSLTNEWFQKG